MLSSERINCYLHGLFLRKIASRANAKALVPQNERWTLIEDVLARVLEEHVAVNVCVDPRQSLAETRWVTLLFCGCESWTWKGKLIFFCIVLSLFCCDASKYKNGGYVWVRDINEHKSCLLRVPDLCSRSASGVYPILLACIIVTFHIDCHHFLIWILWENYFHTSNSNIFHCMNSTTIYYCKLTSKFIFLCFEQPGGDPIQFRRTEGPSLIKLKAGPLRRKKGWGKTMM